MTHDPQEVRATGGCLCGAVRYRVQGGPLRNVINCHCSQCQRTHGNFAAYAAAAIDAVTFIEERGLRWYASSEAGRRGFCAECGASLFWRKEGSGSISIAAGSIDQPSGLRTIGHIYAVDVPDYYAIGDDLRRFPGTSGGALEGDTS